MLLVEGASGIVPQNIGPVLIDKVKSSLFHNSNQTPWMISFNGKLYAFLIAQLGVVNGQNPHFYKSTDNGNTWVELDAANIPANVGDAFVCWDTANSRAIVCFNTRTAAQTPLQLTTFSLATETWGVPFAVGGPNAFRNQSVYAIFIRPDTTIAVVYRGNAAAIGVTQLNGVFWNGAVWSAPVDLGLNMPFTNSIQTTVQPVSCQMDTTGLIHIFIVGVGAALRNYWGYQQWKTDNTLGFFNVFGQGAAFDDARGTNMVIYNGDRLMLGILSDVPPFAFQTRLNLFVGTPLVNPVWVQSTPPALVNPNVPINVPTINFATSPGAATAITTGMVSLNAGASNAAYVLNAETIPAGPVIIAQFVETDINGFLFVQLITSTDGGVTWNVLPSDLVPNFNYYLGFSPVDPAIDIPPAAFTGTLIPSLQLAGSVPIPPQQIVFIGVSRVKAGSRTTIEEMRSMGRKVTGKVGV